MKHYYRKAIPLSKVRTPNGTEIPFVALTDSWAFLELDSETDEGKEFIPAIEKLMKARIGGIEEINEAQYTSMYTEKKSYLTPLLPTHLGGTRDGRESATPGNQILQDTSGVRVSRAAAEASKEQPTAPVIPDPPKAAPVAASKPTVGKLPKAAAAE